MALVTCASSGRGLAIARPLAAERCAVTIVVRRGELLERQAADIAARAAETHHRCHAAGGSQVDGSWIAGLI